MDSIPKTGPQETKKTLPQNTNPAPSTAPNANSENAFFNVMPIRSGSNDVLVQPKNIVVTQNANSSVLPQGGFMETVKKNKFYVIIAAAILIGAPVIYLLVTKLSGNPYEEESLLVDQTKTVPNTPESQGGGFSTPVEWRDKYFPECSDPKSCGDDADPDRDGLKNIEEHTATSDPNNSDSDQDGLSDGDEVHVFSSNPMDSHTAKSADYSDLDYVKGGFDFATDKQLSAEQIEVISGKMRAFGVHKETFVSLGDVLNSLYKFTPIETENPPTASSTPATTTDVSMQGDIGEQQDRDTKRSNTIKNVEIALVGYQKDNKIYPLAADFDSMFTMVKPYLKVATNPLDPINKDPYIYTYASNSGGNNFVLTFYSETAKQIIKKTAEDAQKAAASQEAELFDSQRQMDLETLRTALLLYSQNNIAGNQEYVFPAESKYKTAIVPQYISSIPKDPKTGMDYEYKTTASFDTFTLKAVLDNPEEGTTGFMCNQEECRPF